MSYLDGHEIESFEFLFEKNIGGFRMKTKGDGNHLETTVWVTGQRIFISQRIPFCWCKSSNTTGRRYDTKKSDWKKNKKSD